MSKNTVPTVLCDHPAPIAGALAIASIPIHVLVPFWWSHQIAALILTLFAGVHVGISIIDGRSRVIFVEVVVAIGFVGFAASSMIYEPMWLPLGYIAFGLWSILHRLPIFKVRFPRWYISFSAVFGNLTGIGLWLAWTLR